MVTDLENAEVVLLYQFLAHTFQACEDLGSDGDMSEWDVSNGTDMTFMFIGSSLFDQDIGDLNVSKVTDMSQMFYDISSSTQNYDSLLINWSELNLEKNVTFHAGESQSSSAAADARQHIIDEFN